MVGARIELPEESKLEVWEMVTKGTVWVWVYDRRNDSYKKQRVGGRGGASKKLTISMGDRRYNQEQVIDEMRQHDPFTNGMMLRLTGPELTDDDEYMKTANHKSNDELLEFFQLKDSDDFQEAIVDIESETLLRRLHSLAQQNALAWQLNAITDLLEERFRVGGTQRTVAEMIAANDMQGGHALS